MFQKRDVCVTCNNKHFVNETSSLIFKPAKHGKFKPHTDTESGETTNLLAHLIHLLANARLFPEVHFLVFSPKVTQL